MAGASHGGVFVGEWTKLAGHGRRLLATREPRWTRDAASRDPRASSHLATGSLSPGSCCCVFISFLAYSLCVLTWLVLGKYAKDIILYSLRFLKIFPLTVPTDTKENQVVWGMV